MIDEYPVEANIITDIKHVFREIYRVLKPSGRYFGLLLSLDNETMIKGPLIEANTFLRTEGESDARDRCIHFFSKGEIDSLLLEAGFTKYEINYEVVSYRNCISRNESWLVEAQK